MMRGWIVDSSMWALGIKRIHQLLICIISYIMAMHVCYG